MKKLLTLLSSVITISSVSTMVSSCSSGDSPLTLINASKSDDKLLIGLDDYELKEVNNLSPYTDDSKDNVEFNWDYSHTKKKQIADYKDFGYKDDSIGYYEIANLYFSKIDKLKFLNVHDKDFGWNNKTYSAWYGFNFSLKSTGKSTYELSISSYSKNLKVKFKSDLKIQTTIDSVIDGNDPLSVQDGSENTIINSLAERLSKKDSSIDWKNTLGINNRLASKIDAEPGYLHTVKIDNKSGDGTIEIYSKNGEFGSVVTQKIKISPYNSLNFDYKRNPYYYYDDRTQTQLENINKIDSSVESFNKDKHVIILGFDGVKADEFKKNVVKDNSSNYFEKFYSQAWESVYGWKGLLTGSVSGDSMNVFKMAKAHGLTSYANTMWKSFSSRVFTTSNEQSGAANIKESFGGSYDDLASDGKDWINKKYTNEAVKNYKELSNGENGFANVIKKYKEGKISQGDIDDTLPNDELFKKSIDKDLLNLNTLKSYAAYQNFLDKITLGNSDVPNANLSFHYDTLEDNEGHSFGAAADSKNSFYNSDAYKETMKAYEYEVSDLFTKYGKNHNNLIIVTTDHGRDENDASHQGYDMNPRESWFYSNQDLSKFKSGDYRTNTYSLKEIIYNFLSK